MAFQITSQAFSQIDNYTANIQALRGGGKQSSSPSFFVILGILQREKKVSTENFSNFLLQKEQLSLQYYSYAHQMQFALRINV